MSSFRFIVDDHPNDQVRARSFLFINNRSRRCSKAQMCLHKILHIITSSKTPSPTFRSSTIGEGLGIDLNLRLCSSATGTGSLLGGNEEEEEEEEREERVVGFVDESDSCSAEKIFEGEREKQTDEEEKDGGRRIVVEEEEEKDREREREPEQEQAQEEGGSEITNLQGLQNDEDEDDVVSAKKSIEGHVLEPRKTNNDGFLGLLVEAARLVSGGDETETETESKGRPGQRGERSESTRTEQGARAEVEEGEEALGDCVEASTPATAEAEAEAVRGRTRRRQVLPHRLRDSVLLLEPWTRLSRSNRV